MDVTIIDYGMGNGNTLTPIVRSLEKVGGKARLAKTPAELASAEKIILPGVGSFDNGMRRLNELGAGGNVAFQARMSCSILTRSH